MYTYDHEIAHTYVFVMHTLVVLCWHLQKLSIYSGDSVTSVSFTGTAIALRSK